MRKNRDLIYIIQEIDRNGDVREKNESMSNGINRLEKKIKMIEVKMKA